MVNNGEDEDGGDHHPLTAARDRLQASAREMMKNIEAAMSPSTTTKAEEMTSSSESKLNEDGGGGSLESAFRLFFSSCTTGVTGPAEDDDGTSAAELTAAGDLTPVSTLPSHDSSSISTTTPKPRKQPQRKKQQQQSNRSISAPPRRPSGSLRNLQAMRTRSSNNDLFRDPKIQSNPPIAEHVYEQLFLDQQEEPAVRDPAPPTPITRRRTGGIMAPPSFPTTRPSLPYNMMDCDKDNIIIQNTNSQFDDEISAISAHTLEAMVHNPRALLSCPSSSTPRLERHLSSLSTGTPSTGTSSMSFEQWQAAEQSYWAQQAVRSEKRRRRRTTKQQPLPWLRHQQPAFDLSETAEI